MGNMEKSLPLEEHKSQAAEVVVKRMRRRKRGEAGKGCFMASREWFMMRLIQAPQHCCGVLLEQVRRYLSNFPEVG